MNTILFKLEMVSFFSGITVLFNIILLKIQSHLAVAQAALLLNASICVRPCTPHLYNWSNSSC